MSRTKKEAEAYKAVLQQKIDLIELERDLDLQDFLPEGWRAVEDSVRVWPHKKQVTLRLDADLLGWFKKMGTGYQARINAVLRLYMLARLSKAVETFDELDL